MVAISDLLDEISVFIFLALHSRLWALTYDQWCILFHEILSNQTTPIVLGVQRGLLLTSHKIQQNYNQMHNLPTDKAHSAHST